MEPIARTFKLVGVALGISALAACASTQPPYPTDPQQYQAYVQNMKAQADARQAAGMAQITSAATSGLKPIETVPFAKAPTPAGGPGWFCYTKHQPSTQKDDSSCARTVEACRESARTDEKHKGWKVSPCQPQRSAVCQYVWSSESSGQHACFAAAADCKPFMYSYGAMRQSECGSVD